MILSVSGLSVLKRTGMFGPSKKENSTYYVAEHCSRCFCNSTIFAHFFSNIQTLTNSLLSYVYALKGTGMFGPSKKKDSAYYVAERCSRCFCNSTIFTYFVWNIQILSSLLSYVYALKRTGIFGLLEKKNGTYYVAERCGHRFCCFCYFCCFL